MIRNSKPQLLLCACVLAVPASAQPVVRGIVNAANGDLTQVARGSFVSIFGQNLGTQAGPPAALPLPTSMGGATVNIKPDGGTQTYQAFLHFVSPGQINAIIPSTVPPGQASLTVTVNNATSPAARVQIAASSFGIFTINSQTAGLAIAQNYESPTSLPLNLYTNAARPGQTLILWGTGLGAYTGGSDGEAPQAGNIVNNATVLVAGYSITPFYAGRAPGIPGVDQINFTLPQDAPIPDGCSLEVQVQIGDLIQQGSATIAKSSNGPVCQHPFALSSDQLSSLQNGGTIKAAIAHLLRSHGIEGIVNGSPLGSVAEEIQVLIRKFTANGSPLTDQSYPFALAQAPGSCTAAHLPGSAIDLIDHIDFGLTGNSPLDFGSSLTLSGPGGSKDVDAFTGITTLYQGADIPGVSTAQSFLSDGDWTLSARGGKDGGSFQAHFTLQNQFKLQNLPTTISKGQPLTISWAGGGDNDLVRIFVAGLAFSGNSPFIICTEHAPAHSFTVSGDLTSQLASDAGQAVLVAYAFGAPVSFTAPLAGGGNLDSANIVTDILEAFTGIRLQ